MEECDCDQCCPSIGPQGAIGIQGQSFVGAQGPIGHQGPVAIGAQGDHGYQGALLMGSDGFQGPQGFSTQDGMVGKSGGIGAQGSQDESTRGPQGNIGHEGGMGYASQIGAQGVDGLSDRGQQGPSGYRGQQGAVGDAAGTQGPIGVQNGPGPTLLNLSIFNQNTSFVLTSTPQLVYNVATFGSGTTWLRALFNISTTATCTVYIADSSGVVPIVGSIRTLTTNGGASQSLEITVLVAPATYFLWASSTLSATVNITSCTTTLIKLS